MEQNELQARWEKPTREAKQNEIAHLQEERAREARVAEKEMEIARASNSRGTSFWIASLAWLPEDNFTKVSV